MALDHPTILIAEDDDGHAFLVEDNLRRAGVKAPFRRFSDGQEALDFFFWPEFEPNHPYLLLLDIRMPKVDGIEVLRQIKASDRLRELPVIILTAHGTIPEAVSAVQRGVAGYLTKPFDPKALLTEVERALTVAAGPREAGAIGDEWRRDIITRNHAMEDVLAKARLVAESDASVLISGESGSGKEIIARAIHRASPRRDRPFVAINCGAIPEQLLESELFGHVRGSFTGAVRDHKGLFQTANQGTLFLDEIGDMPVALQVKLLRVLQEQEVRPVGSTTTHKVNVRVISATNRNLKARIAEGKFREDLFYRLNVINVTIPPLRERKEDIAELARHFLAKYAKKLAKPVTDFTPEALELLSAYRWPGNVRELENTVHRAVLLATGEEIGVDAIRLPDGSRLDAARTPAEQAAQIAGQIAVQASQTAFNLVGRTVAALAAGTANGSTVSLANVAFRFTQIDLPGAGGEAEDDESRGGEGRVRVVAALARPLVGEEQHDQREAGAVEQVEAHVERAAVPRQPGRADRVHDEQRQPEEELHRQQDLRHRHRAPERRRLLVAGEPQHERPQSDHGPAADDRVAEQVAVETPEVHRRAA